jgi:periplasmic protein TonB
MSTSSAQHATPPHAIHPSWRPSRTALLIAGAAFAFGLLLFLLLWMDQRNNTDFYRAPVSPPAGAAPTFDPLPAPLPAGDTGTASGMQKPGDEVFAERPQVVEEAPAPLPSGAPPPPRPQEPALAARANPVPVSSPAPRYPAEAARRRESGTVLVRVHVGPDGVPTSTSLVQSSQSRSLDKAALDAVRRWRFQPAVVDGHPTVGSVVVPIEFNLGR